LDLGVVSVRSGWVLHPIDGFLAANDTVGFGCVRECSPLLVLRAL
jgi:hypothetical protein